MTLLRAMLSRRWILTTLLVVAGTLVCVRLGIWQLDRLEQRRAFNERYLEATLTSPLILESAPLADLTLMEYRTIFVTGRYDPINQVVLRNQFHDGEPGFLLLTPLVFADNTAILVARGWIPAAGNASPSDWRKYDQLEDVTLGGIIRLGQTEPGLGGVPDPEGQSRLDFWNLVNVERISRQVPYPLASAFIQPDPDPALTAPPYPSQPVIEVTEGPHMGYALQWFSFAALLFVGYPFFLRQMELGGSPVDSQQSAPVLQKDQK
jgi:surfeit locus 1 family protein